MVFGKLFKRKNKALKPAKSMAELSSGQKPIKLPEIEIKQSYDDLVGLFGARAFDVGLNDQHYRQRQKNKLNQLPSVLPASTSSLDEVYHTLEPARKTSAPTTPQTVSSQSLAPADSPVTPVAAHPSPKVDFYHNFFDSAVDNEELHFTFQRKKHFTQIEKRPTYNTIMSADEYRTYLKTRRSSVSSGEGLQGSVTDDEDEDDEDDNMETGHLRYRLQQEDFLTRRRVVKRVVAHTRTK